MSNDNNPFNDFDLGAMMKAWSDHPMVKAVTENEFMNKAKEGKLPEMDMSEIMESQKKNLDSLKEVNARAAEGFGKLAEQQSALMAQTLTGLKEYAEKAGEKAEDGFDAKFEDAQAVFKKTVASFSEVGDTMKEAGEDIFEVASKRMKDSMQELEELAKKFKD